MARQLFFCYSGLSVGTREMGGVTFLCQICHFAHIWLVQFQLETFICIHCHTNLQSTANLGWVQPTKKWCKTFIKRDGGALNTLFWWRKCCNYGNPRKTSPRLIQFFLSRTCYFAFASCIINPELKFNSVRFVNQLDRLVPENWLDSFKNRTSLLSSPVEYGLDSSLSPTEEKVCTVCSQIKTLDIVPHLL